VITARAIISLNILRRLEMAA